MESIQNGKNLVLKEYMYLYTYTHVERRNWPWLVSNLKRRFSCLSQNKTNKNCETAADAKWKRTIQVLQIGRMVDSHLKDHSPFLLKPGFLYK